jgi:hypothetical protein
MTPATETLADWLTHCEQQHHKVKDRPLDDLRVRCATAWACASRPR